MSLHLFPSKLMCAFRVLSALAVGLPAMLRAQAEMVKPVIPVVEPGLEQAVKWHWQVEPSDMAA